MAVSLNSSALLSLAALLLLILSIFYSPFSSNSKSYQMASSVKESTEDSIISMPTASTTTEIFGVKIEKNSPQSKLDQLGVSSWPKYSGQPGKMPWMFKTAETMYLLEGKVKVSVDGYEGDFEIGGGDLVVFPKGMKITWDVLEAVSKHYHLEE